jgi:hypothetical protein
METLILFELSLSTHKNLGQWSDYFAFQEAQPTTDLPLKRSNVMDETAAVERGVWW